MGQDLNYARLRGAMEGTHAGRGQQALPRERRGQSHPELFSVSDESRYGRKKN